jgi:hypothetical protein
MINDGKLAPGFFLFAGADTDPPSNFPKCVSCFLFIYQFPFRTRYKLEMTFKLNYIFRVAEF